MSLKNIKNVYISHVLWILCFKVATKKRRKGGHNPGGKDTIEEERAH